MAPALIKPYYYLTEYATLTGESLATVRQWVRRGTLKTGRIGKKHVVWLNDIIAENPELFRSITEAEQLRAMLKRL
jgi:hypothetical protein